MLTLDESVESLRNDRLHRFATCWKIERTDGEVFRFTDHDGPIEVDGEDYLPTGGFAASARQKQTGLRAQNLEIVGMLSDDIITHDDLRAGRYREAEITEMLVDWQYPFAGVFVTNKYWITEVTFSGEHWEARIEGLTRWLEPVIGNVYSRTCRHTLGSAECGVDLSLYAKTQTVSQVDTARRIFRTTGLTADDDYYNWGYLDWTAGKNVNLKSEVKDYTKTNNIIELQLRTPFDIEVDDAFTLYPGCNKLMDTCKNKFNSLVNFGGFPFMPGNDRMMKTPRAK